MGILPEKTGTWIGSNESTLLMKIMVISVFFDSVDALILGRKTYDTVACFNEWPYKEKRVIVLSNTLSAVREEAELFCGKLDRLTSDLYADGIKHLWVDGGIAISTFLETGMVDQVILSVIPIILGSGISLFSSMKQEHACHLVSSQSFPSGLMQLQYEIVE